MKYLFTFFTIALFCWNWNYQTNHSYSNNIPAVIDTLEQSKNAFYQINEPLIADYDILYIGSPKDTLWINHTHRPYKNHILDDLDLEKAYKHITDSSINMSIYIDTTQIIKDDINIELTLMELAEMTYKETAYYNAYPVCIQNHSIQTVKVGTTGYDEQLSLILEAIDSSGNWRPIEHPFIAMCGFGILPIVLNPQELLITGVLIPKGAYKTQFRLNYYGKYSNIFEGSLSYGQFEPITEESEPFMWED